MNADLAIQREGDRSGNKDCQKQSVLHRGLREILSGQPRTYSMNRARPCILIEVRI
jgi:hypothetical protein